MEIFPPWLKGRGSAEAFHRWSEKGASHHWPVACGDTAPLEWQQLVYLCNDTVKAWRHQDDYVMVWKQKQGAVIAQRGENGFISFRVDEAGD